MATGCIFLTAVLIYKKYYHAAFIVHIFTVYGIFYKRQDQDIRFQNVNPDLAGHWIQIGIISRLSNVTIYLKYQAWNKPEI